MNSAQAKNCQNCHKDFVIEPDDFGFYEKIGVPLPTFCPDCRHARRFVARGPNRLWHRQCQCAGSTSSPQAGSNHVYQNTVSHFHSTTHCPNEFETSYAPHRKEMVYCEACYNAEVI